MMTLPLLLTSWKTIKSRFIGFVFPFLSLYQCTWSVCGFVTRHWRQAFTYSCECCCHQRSFLGHWTVVRRSTGAAVTLIPTTPSDLQPAKSEVLSCGGRPKAVLHPSHEHCAGHATSATCYTFQSDRLNVFYNDTLSLSDVPRVCVFVCVDSYKYCWLRESLRCPFSLNMCLRRENFKACERVRAGRLAVFHTAIFFCQSYNLLSLNSWPYIISLFLSVFTSCHFWLVRSKSSLEIYIF